MPELPKKIKIGSSIVINPETPETGSCEAGYFVPDDGKPHGI